MKKSIIIIFIGLLSLAACQKNDDSPSVQQPALLTLPDKADEVIDYSNGFGVDLFREVAVTEEGNLMVSPLSASVALTMLLNGCDGDTYTQIHQMLGYQDLSMQEINEVYQSLVEQLLSVDPQVELALANAVWYRQGFEVHQSYLEAMGASFDARIEGLDFYHPSALETMNQWASDNTNGKITRVLDEISPQAVMFLMNALYFKGDWTWQFQPDKTTQAGFYLEDGTVVSVPTMQGHAPVRFYEGDTYHAAELYYGRQNFSMVIILPNDISEFLAGFEPQQWKEITSGLDAMDEPVSLDLFMPKFSFEYEKRLNEQLQALGMIDAFIPELSDLSGISDADIFVSFVKQNTFVNVNEEGTEAAAVTTIGVELTAIASFTVDRPFVFAIRERTSNTLMFIGKVMNPAG